MSYRRHSKPEIRELSLELRDVINDWDDFAVQLPGITRTHLSRARTDCPGNINRQKQYVYQKWRDVYPRATWNDVVDALNKAQLHDSASSLEQKLTPSEPANNTHTITRSTADATTTSQVGYTSKPTTVQLLDALQPAEVEWYNLGLRLGYGEGTLDAIKEDNNYKAGKCMRDLVKQWRQNYPRKGWGDMVSALRKIGMNGIADNIERQYGVAISPGGSDSDEPNGGVAAARCNQRPSRTPNDPQTNKGGGGSDEPDSPDPIDAQREDSSVRKRHESSKAQPDKGTHSITLSTKKLGATSNSVPLMIIIVITAGICIVILGLGYMYFIKSKTCTLQ